MAKGEGLPTSEESPEGVAAGLAAATGLPAFFEAEMPPVAAVGEGERVRDGEQLEEPQVAGLLACGGGAGRLGDGLRRGGGLRGLSGLLGGDLGGGGRGIPSRSASLQAMTHLRFSANQCFRWAGL